MYATWLLKKQFLYFNLLYLNNNIPNVLTDTLINSNL
jgi:hypothetical protein